MACTRLTLRASACALGALFATFAEISPAYLHMNVNGIQEAAGSLRPYFDQEGQFS
jgi:hypothetical protein